jgi:serine/threonine protein kinase/dipeptidyl aminopeptidase/acylaminoacyl peptidase
MLETRVGHPSADELRCFGEGRLAPEAAGAIEAHLALCEACCRLLEEAPADSFAGRLRRAAPAQATTADASGTLVEMTGIPPELTDHAKYRVLGLLGQGGMGAVYRAEHLRMERPVALKVINPGLLRNPATVQRFQQEVKAAAKLHHPNIVTAFDADQAGELHFLVMEFVEGQSLAQRVGERGPLPSAEACECVRQAALGLQHAHERGMVHRDIKPHNLMRTADGTVKILDFGLARLAHPVVVDAGSSSTASPPGLTAAGSVMGTADYIAPEQAADPRTADIRADIYSLGCTLFHLLTGGPPFPDGTVQDKIAKHTTEPLPPLAGVLPGLAAVLAKMTAKEPAQRYATAAEVVEALTPFCRVTATRQARSRLRRWLAVAAVLLAVVLAAGIVVSLTNDRGDVTTVQSDDKSFELTVTKGRIVSIRDLKTDSTWNVDTENLRIADASRPEGLTIELPRKGKVTLRSRDGRTVTVSTEPNEVAESPKPVRVLDPVELAKLPNAADALKQSEIPKDALAYVVGGDPEKAPPELVAVLGDMRFRYLHNSGNAMWRPAYRQDGKLLAVPGSGEVRLFDAESGHLVRSIPTHCVRAVFSPDGSSLATGGDDGRVRLWEVATGRALWPLPQMPGPVEGIGCLEFSGDGQRILATCAKGAKLASWDVATGKARITVDTLPDEQRIVDMVRSPDGKRFAYLRAGGLVNYEYPPEFDSSIKGRRVAYSPDGKAWAVVTDRWNVVLYPQHGDHFPKEIKARDVELLGFADGGKTLLTVGRDLDGRVVPQRWDAAGKPLPTIRDIGTKDERPVALSPDGRTLATSPVRGGVVRLYDTETGKPRIPDPGHTGRIRAVAWSPDGKLLASADGPEIRLWDLAKGNLIRVVNPNPYNPIGGTVSHLLFSPDSQFLAALIDVSSPATGERSVAAVWQVSARDSAHKLYLENHRGALRALAYSPDGKLLATAGGDNTIRLWQTKDGAEYRILPHRGWVQALQFSPDGLFLVSADNDHMRVWEVGSGTERKKWLNQAAPAELIFLPDAETLAARRSDGEIWLIDWQTGKPRRKLPPPVPNPTGGDKWSLGLGPAGRLLAFQDLRGLVLSQPGADPPQQQAFRLSPNPVYGRLAVAFSPDGRYVAAGNPDGTICLLRLAKRGCAPVLPAYTELGREQP